MALDIKQAIMAKKSALADRVQQPLSALSERCAGVWPDPDGLDAMLTAASGSIRGCHLCYAWDLQNVQLSSLVTPRGVETQWRGRDLTARPYLRQSLPFRGVMLSSVYISSYTRQQCITALQAVNRDNRLLGFIAVDFNLHDLPWDTGIAGPEVAWRQYKGDPAVRSTLFMQTRSPSIADRHIDEITDLVEVLMCEHGVFHSKIHFSSGRCTLWLYDDPYRYHILGIEEIIDPDTCLAYPMHDYPADAVVDPCQIGMVLKVFRELRLADDTLYLRSGSINIVNGMLGLTFSCDGSHYMPVDEFLERDLDFWLGPGSTAGPASLARDAGPPQVA